ncbi:MAG: valyl-tRNA synthetase [Fusobacteria bacterium]|nr:MAG: valyl-tRNA synthetase [Fusobacteriota bacterium]KAF0230049.1 MAG: valyl-tRNA [Fusobacteriota bacterium]
METKYNPGSVEKKWYKYWEDNKYFHQEVDKSKKPFSIVMPPPNVTGQLHLGHAMDNTLQDILIRYKRMAGYNTVWIPGTDHAGIATQAKVEEELKKQEGLSKYDLGREKFLERVWDWKEKYHERIASQLRLLGSSCDWDRERFTMDEGCSIAVKEVFKQLYDKGLIYRGEYMVNWCPKCHTTISDIEVEHSDRKGNLWYFRYLVEGSNDYITIATTRPETMLGDSAVAVSKDDERYTKYVGKNLILPIIGRKIPIIEDEYVEKEFGTGAVKITPSHDPNDFEISQRHDLEHYIVIDKQGKMTGDVGKYIGMDRYECRDAIVKELEELGALVKVEVYENSVGCCYRCDTVIEPLVSKQWFVRMKPLAEAAVKKVLDGEAKFIPERFTKVYLSWMENIRDWCISRQLWWGHRIPVYYCKDCGEMICDLEKVDKCPKCQSINIEQDPDVLDTWFSSALWPFSTLGWPEKTLELEHFYPTSVLVTGRDIIFFWVARMLFMGIEFMDKVPFDDIFIHGLILDEHGRKMSKSLGNGIDPLVLIDEYGADTLRYMLVTGNTPGNDIRFHTDRLEAIRNFCNKIWNASRFVMMNLEDYDGKREISSFTLADKWIIGEYNKTIKNVTNNLDKYELGLAADEIYEFIRNSFCDWYIEAIKDTLYKGTLEEKQNVQKILVEILSGTLSLLHPFMPFITEEIWQNLPHKGNTIMYAKWPVIIEDDFYKKDISSMEHVMDSIRQIRNIRAEMNVPIGKKIPIIIYPKPGFEQIANDAIKYFISLAKGSEVIVEKADVKRIEKSAMAVNEAFEIFIPLEGLVDIKEEKGRLNKDLVELQSEIDRINNKLGNIGFMAKAPIAVVDKEKEKLAMYEEKYQTVKTRLEEI